MDKITFDQNNYQNFIDILTSVAENLKKLHQNWESLQEFYGKMESFIDDTVVTNMEDFIAFSQMGFSGEFTTTDPSMIESKLRISTANVIY